jgi:DNA polymerase III gamma/tau subunit
VFLIIKTIMVANELLTLKYQPTTIDGIILPDAIKRKFLNGLCNNYLFSGPSGVGKSTLAHIIADQFGYDYKYINASTHGRIDVIRDEITSFATSFSLRGTTQKKKLIILDEADGSSDSFFKALRATMDDVSDNCLFIVICNYLSKIPTPIISRVDHINFLFSDVDQKKLLAKYGKRLIGICKAENIPIEKDAVKLVLMKYLPDFRKVLNVIQGLSANEITIDSIDTFVESDTLLFDLIFGTVNPVQNYEFIVKQYGNRVDVVLEMLGTDLIDYMLLHDKFHTYIPQFIIVAAKYQYQHAFVINKLTNLLACIFEMQLIIKKHAKI